ncbi:MAG TPA: flagellar biosynthetic protein FliR [Candidatus Acidoferrales bacterium]|nr:flagellar biosynthetic protein FliR [Candidatus Acidoferrales bacterium]
MSATGLLVFARCAGFAFRAPGLAHPSVPPAVRAGMAALLALAIVPSTRAGTSPNGIALVAALVAEFLLGTAIGIAASLIYDAAYAGGRAVDDYTGVKAIAPSAQLVAPSGFGRVWSLAFTGAYFLLGVYRFTLLAFAQSFVRVAPGAPFDASAWGSYALALASTVFAVGVAVAAPAIALSFVVHVAIGTLSRAIPRFGSFTLVFPPAFGAALIATALAVPALMQLAGRPLLAFPGSR